MKYYGIILLTLLLSCASGDNARYYSIPLHKDSLSLFLQSAEDSLNRYGFFVKSVHRDSLHAFKLIKQGALNEREVQLLITLHDQDPPCRIQVKVTTYFRQDTIIEYYDELRGFPASNRRDFSDAILCIRRLGEATLPKKKKKIANQPQG